MNGSGQSFKDAFFNPGCLAQLGAPLIQVFGWLGMQPVLDEGVALAEGVWIGQFPSSAEMPTPLMMALEKLMAMPG